MKRIFLLFVVVCSMTHVIAQTEVREAATNYLNGYKLDSALESINRCVKDPSTSRDALSWLIRGNIYLEIANSNDEMYKSLDPNPLQQASNSYKKAAEFDQNKVYTEDIFAKVNLLRNHYFNQAVDNYNQKQYKEAMLAFEKGANAMAIVNFPDTISLFYAAACAGLADEKTKAKEYYIELLKQKAKSPAIYISLSDIYRQEQDSASALKIVRDGQKLYPDALNLMLTEANIYLTFGDSQKALKNLKLATKKDASNPTVFFALGTIYEATSNDISKSELVRQESWELAADAYKSAILLNPNYFEPNYNLGALYVNKAADIDDRANKVPLDAETEYEKLKAEADKYLEEAIPYLEKASEIRPDDMNTLWSLKQIYTRIKRAEELKIITDKIDAVQQK
jgi:Tfp pilus assembly protein PilF